MFLISLSFYFYRLICSDIDFDSDSNQSDDFGENQAEDPRLAEISINENSHYDTSYDDDSYISVGDFLDVSLGAESITDSEDSGVENGDSFYINEFDNVDIDQSFESDANDSNFSDLIMALLDEINDSFDIDFNIINLDESDDSGIDQTNDFIINESHDSVQNIDDIAANDIAANEDMNENENIDVDSNQSDDFDIEAENINLGLAANMTFIANLDSSFELETDQKDKISNADEIDMEDSFSDDEGSSQWPKHNFTSTPKKQTIKC